MLRETFIQKYIVERTTKAKKEDRKNRMRKRSVVEWNKIHNVARDKRIKFSREQKKLR